MIKPDFAFNAMRLSDSRVNENLYGVFLIFIVQGSFIFILYFTNYGIVVFVLVLAINRSERHFVIEIQMDIEEFY